LGKVIDLYFEAPDREYATKELYTLSDRLFANTVIEDWSFELEEINNFPSGT
jgi:phosphoribosylformylglycinamidine synthase